MILIIAYVTHPNVRLSVSFLRRSQKKLIRGACNSLPEKTVVSYLDKFFIYQKEMIWLFCKIACLADMVMWFLYYHNWDSSAACYWMLFAILMLLIGYEK